jgi:hypothetical protein
MQSAPITIDVVCSNLYQGEVYLKCDKGGQLLATGRWFSPGPLISSTNKTDHHDVTEILLKQTCISRGSTLVLINYTIYELYNSIANISKNHICATKLTNRRVIYPWGIIVHQQRYRPSDSDNT